MSLHALIRGGLPVREAQLVAGRVRLEDAVDALDRYEREFLCAEGATHDATAVRLWAECAYTLRALRRYHDATLDREVPL